MLICLSFLLGRYVLLGLYVFSESHQYLENKVNERWSVYQELAADVDKVKGGYLLIVRTNSLFNVLTCKHFYQRV